LITKTFRPHELDGYVDHNPPNVWNYDNFAFIGWDTYYTNDNCDAYYPFINFDIPKNAEIEQAIFKLSVYAVQNANVETNFYCNIDNTQLITTYTDYTNMIKSINFVPYTFEQTLSETFVYLDVTELIKEKIQGENYVRGENIIIFSYFDDYTSSSGYVDSDTWEYNNSNSLTVTYSVPYTPTLEDNLKGNRIESFEYELLTYNEDRTELIHKENLENYVKQCDLNINFENTISSTLNVLLDENDFDIDYFNDFIKPKYIMNNYTFPLGIYTITAPSKTNDYTFTETNIDGYSILKILDDDKITESITIEEGENVIDTVISYIESCGDWLKHNIESNDEVLSEDLTYEVGKSKLYVINGLLNTINYYNLYCDGNGVFKSSSSDIESNTSYTFKDDNESLYDNTVKLTKDYSNIFNQAIVISNETSEDTEPIYSAKTYEDLGIENSVPFSITNIGRTIPMIFNSETVTQDYADARSERELLNILEIDEQIEYKHAFVSPRENDGLPYDGDCFKFIHSKLNLNANYRFIYSSWTLNVGNLWNTTIRRVTNV